MELFCCAMYLFVLLFFSLRCNCVNNDVNVNCICTAKEIVADMLREERNAELHAKVCCTDNYSIVFEISCVLVVFVLLSSACKSELLCITVSLTVYSCHRPCWLW